MKKFKEIQLQVETSFDEYISELLRQKDDKAKYYYRSIDFFENVGGLSFNYFNLTPSQKEKINEIGVDFFDRKDVTFEVNKNSHRHDILIKNINNLFTEKVDKVGQSFRYEYLKEYIFWQILLYLSKSLSSISNYVVEIQKNNFLLTYVKYLIIDGAATPLKGYVNYTRTQQGEALIKKLKLLESQGVENQKLLRKIENLYVLKDFENKIHFIFSRAGGEEKEELRELLDVMGREETGKLYRGQASSNWKLDASITREPKYLENEVDMYYDILSLKPDAFENDHSVYDRLITMQHYGMPTRLLDITRNPLVAIFFACNNMPMAKNDGVVFTFKPENKEVLNFEDSKLKSLLKLFDKNCTDKATDELLTSICFIKGVAKNQRINNQSGDFIFVGNGDRIAKDLHELPKLTIIIDAPTKKVLLEQLESLNIHGGSVYPDLTHMSNYISHKYLDGHNVVNKDFKIDLDLSAFEKTLNPNLQDNKLESLDMKYRKNEITEIKQLTTYFSSDVFWSNHNKEKLDRFASSNHLDQEEVKKIIEDIVAFDKIPIRSDIANIMQPKPKVSEYQTAVQNMTESIINFAKGLDRAV